MAGYWVGTNLTFAAARCPVGARPAEGRQALHKLTLAAFLASCLSACGGKTASDASSAASASSGGMSAGGASTIVIATGGAAADGLTATAAGGLTGTAAGGLTSAAAGGLTSTAAGGLTSAAGTTATGGGGVELTWPLTCIAGSKGCLCDSRGHCAPGLTCTPQPAPKPSLCCDGTDCQGSGVGMSAACSAVDGGATCTPGITVPAEIGTNDNCGYPETYFNASVMLCGIAATGGGTETAQIQVFYNDQHAMTLGCDTSTFPVSTLPSIPGAVYYPQTGDPSCVDIVGRLMRPVLYITDITNDPNCRAGDQQQGGKAYDPVAVFGIWKSASMDSNSDGIVVNADPAPMNLWDLGEAADPVPAVASANCPCTASSCVTTGHMGRGYGAEVRFEAGLVSGHTYRLQVIMQGGHVLVGNDTGEICATYCAGSFGDT